VIKPNKQPSADQDNCEYRSSYWSNDSYHNEFPKCNPMAGNV